MHLAGYLLFGDNFRQQRDNVIEEDEHVGLKMYRKILRNNSDPFALDPVYFNKFYRMPPALALQLIDLLSDSLVEQALCKLPVHIQVLAALRFYAEGCYQKGGGQDFNHPVSQSTFSRCLIGVTIALNEMSADWIRFPTTMQERQQVSERFQLINRIPGILGLVDCVVIKMVRPAVNEEAFFHYKHSHSMNVQVVSDSNYLIQGIRICPGSSTDRHIWKYSDIQEHLLNLRQDQNIVAEEGNYYILGDSGYTPSPVLLTPIRDAVEGTPEARYTHNHVRTRCKVEQLFGVLSNVWLCISRRRVLHYHPEKVAQIIMACAVLHNFRRLNGIIDDLPEPDFNIENFNIVRDEQYRLGLLERDRLVQEYYNN